MPPSRFTSSSSVPSSPLLAFAEMAGARRHPLPWRVLALSLLCTWALSASAQGPGIAEDRFADRLLRVGVPPVVEETPRFDGDVAEVVRTTTADGNVTERRVWRFDERGRLASTEWVVYAGSNEFSYTSTWAYGEDGLPSVIEFGGRQANLLLLSWEGDSLDITSDTQRLRYTYDAAGDVLTLEQLEPSPLRQVYEFRDDGSSRLTFSTADDSGSWQQSLTGEADRHNVRTAMTTAALETLTAITAHDPFGNPMEATRERSGQATDTMSLTWETTFR